MFSFRRTSLHIFFQPLLIDLPASLAAFAVASAASLAAFAVAFAASVAAFAAASAASVIAFVHVLIV